ncbi:hypothetical protein [Streptomyces fractus]
MTLRPPGAWTSLYLDYTLRQVLLDPKYDLGRNGLGTLLYAK